MSSVVDIKSLTSDELKAFLTENGFKAFRAKQVEDWLKKGVLSFDEMKNLGLSNDDLDKIMEQNRLELNSVMPAYSKISVIKLHEEEFEKTPKRSIKRFLYV